ncbi:xanthine dehydrogenase molybdenum-binding subunit [Clostridium aceticum]|uniref:Xanthine dehydrogenase molybdenum-binding subunit n=1 Tax=Clostridium aceticum TaxID=84022 RepID=A0A0D8I8A5_9CLOT|nr:molybdopterin cofactor-binding domain-containing protein [Clostridium aceticum]AKL97282.1 xanthine dehydrogenase molybdenum-binding subunit [Clostridium aceticum]KJF26304.1 hypothetical protein TZ02_14125 [Clostridium aceticum]
MQQKLKYVGENVPIHDVKEKVTGKIKYVGDMLLPDMLYAKLVLSTIPHGNIVKIHTSKAEAVPGVVKIYTHHNTPSTLYNSHKWIAGLEVVKDERLFAEKVRHVGDRVAAVVAKDKETAEYAASLIEVEYEVLPSIIDPLEALKEDSVKIHAEGNKIVNKEIKCGAPEETFDETEIMVESQLTTQKIHHAAMETHVCLAAVEANGHLTVWAPCQVVYQVRLIISEVLGLSVNKIRVIKPPMGGSFGGKGIPTLEPVCAFICYDLGKPVKLQMDRRESIIATKTRNATIGKVKTAIDREGNILARDIEMLVDGGAYFTNAEAVTMAMGKKAFRLYKIDNQRYRGEAVYTNTPVGGACRGYGSPQIHALTEINIDAAAKKIGMDPVEFRLKNLVKPFDKDLIGGPDLGNARVIDCVKKGMEVFEWKKKYNRTKDTGRFVRGVGMACATHGNGYYGAYQDFITMDLRLTEDGEAILKSGIHDLGCGTVTTMKQIVAEVLDIEPNEVLATEGDTLLSPFDSAGTQASRVTFVCGGAAMKTAELLKEKLLISSAKVLNCSPAEIIIESGEIWNRNHCEEKISYGEMVIKLQRAFKEDMHINYTYQSKGNPAVYAANFAEVEIDTFTGLVKVLDVVAVHDIGKAINPGFVEGQVQGAIQMGIGFALTEEITVNEDGKIGADNFSKYHVVNAPDMPDVRVLLVEEGEEHGPFGAKSVGEVCTVPITPAILNAINHALEINIHSLPATPEKVLQALRDKNIG